MNNSIQRIVLLFAFVCMTSWPFPLLAGDHGHEQHGKHVHGEGELKLVLDNNELHIEFLVPAMSIVGFEHEAESNDQKQAINAAIATLNNGSRIYSFSAEAECTLQSADAQFVILGKEDHAEGHEEKHHDEGHESGHHEEGHEEGHHDEAKHEEEHHDGHESGHAEFKNQYTYRCTHPEKLESVEILVFKEFERVEHIDVDLIVASKQSTQELSAKQPVINLKECRFGFGSWCLF